MKLLLAHITRNRQGDAVPTEQTLQADPLRIGRGADCKLHLPDPRVALHHASMGLSDDGKCFVEAAAGAVKVDGRFERSMRLKPGQKITVGPFEIIVLPTPADFDLALSVELVEPLIDTSKADGKRAALRASLAQTWLSKRAMSWLGASLILLAFLAWPVMHALDRADHQPNAAANHQANTQTNTQTSIQTSSLWGITPDASWDPGALSSAHHSFGRDCGKCHATPFVQTKTEQCESCHQSIGWHFALNTKAANALHESVFMQSDDASRCASCHRDHKGPLGLVRQDSPLCTQCHADLKTRHPETASPNIAEFGKDHPGFKLSMLVPGKSGPDAVVRVAQSSGAGSRAIEASNLKFPHDIHMAKKGVRGPNASNGGKIVMECKNCHVPDENGIRFKPTTMKEHCQDCHSLEFEPKATNRQVPHGDVGEVMATVSEFYAQAALADTPIDVVVQDGVRRPGERLQPTQRQSALTWATEKAAKTTRELMEDRVCFTCHEISKTNAMREKKEGDAINRPWQIAPIAITQHWLPKSRFPHNRHNTHECGSCHKVEGSKLSSDIAIPDIKNCQTCHGGNATVADKAPGTCETCHGFHVGGSRSGTPVPLPGGLPPNRLPYDPKQKAAQKMAVRQDGAVKGGGGSDSSLKNFVAQHP